MSERPLSPMQQRFVDEYLIDLNATQAAIRAGYAPKYADRQGPALLGKPSIRAAITAHQADRSLRTKIDQDWALTRLKLEAEREGKGSSHAARVAALGLAMKHLGMVPDKMEHSGPDGGPVNVNVSTTDRIDRHTEAFLAAASRGESQDPVPIDG